MLFKREKRKTGRVFSFLLTLAMILVLIPVSAGKVQAAETPTVSYRTHVQTYGWQDYVSNGEMAGTSGKAKRLESIQISISGVEGLGVTYRTHCQTYGWLDWVSDDEKSGTEGKAKRLEAIQIRLTGPKASLYDVYYRVHAQTYGWMAWTKNGNCAGTSGKAKRLEGIQIVILPKGQAPAEDLGGITSWTDKFYSALDGSNGIYEGGEEEPYVEPEPVNPEPVNPEPVNPEPVNPEPQKQAPNVTYQTHVQTYGWQDWRNAGEVSGTDGDGKRLEAIRIALPDGTNGGITYKVHAQTYGWMDWVSNGEMAGTSGKAKRLEAIYISLTGAIADEFDVYYRVRTETYGWLAWAKNGEMAGTSGLAKRLEAIQIVIQAKGTAAPSAAYQGITSYRSTSCISADGQNGSVISVNINDLDKNKIVNVKVLNKDGLTQWPMPYSKEVGWEFGDGHSGVDIMCPTGTPIVAAGNGTVIGVYPDGTPYWETAGNAVLIDHGNGIVTRYYHMDSFNCVEGQKVKAGDVIGFAGETGYATAPHLHFCVVKNGSLTDPLGYYEGYDHSEY